MQVFHQTIGEMLAAVAEAHPKRSALIHTTENVDWSHARLQGAVDSAAAGMLANGIRARDKVALWAPNIAEWIVAFLGLARMGAVVVPIDPAAAEENVRYILEQSESRALILPAKRGDGRFVGVAADLQKRLPSLEKIIAVGECPGPGMIPWRELAATGQEKPAPDLRGATRAVRPEDPVAIMYTSGTTGAPKGVVLDHLGLINKSMHATERQGIGADDRLCLFFPLFHMFGNTCIALAGLLRGAALIVPGSGFDPEGILAAVAAHRCTAVYGSPSMLIALVDHPRFEKRDWRTVTKGIIGGAPCPMELMRRIVEDIGVSDVTVAWGITETASWITMTRPQDPLELRVATIGTPLACNEVKIVDPKTGEALPPGRQGELCTRGFLMKEYYRMPAATAAAIDRDGWFHTGDLGTMDSNGYVRITGRLKDVIEREGVAIFPVEIEEVIYEMPEVSEVQVFGFDSPGGDRRVAAWFKVKDGCRLSTEAVAEHVRRRVAPEKLPQHYSIVKAFPMTGSGKVQKYKMAELAAAEYDKS